MFKLIPLRIVCIEVRAKRLDFGHSHLKMSWIQHTKDGVFAHTPNISPSSFSDNFHKEPNSNKISPAVLFVIVILAVIFFVSGLIHLLVRFIIKHPSSSTSSQANRHQEISTSEVLQRQLQQLFNQHDTGLDQAFIDALPVFMYKEVVLVGPKEPFDCAVCLCEFSDKDKLRLLPTCSHAFHISCIDTWLLTNSTCPLCRGALFNPGLLSESPTFDFDDSREEDGYHCNRDPVLSAAQKTIDIEENAIDKASIPVRLGKFRKLNVEEEEGEGEASSSNLDARRCYSLGSYQYVVGDFNLKVPLSNELNACNVKLAKLRERYTNLSNEEDMEGKRIGIGTKTDSYSFSKIWLWSKKGKFASTSECQMENRPPNMNLPRLEKTEGN